MIEINENVRMKVDEHWVENVLSENGALATCVHMQACIQNYILILLKYIFKVIIYQNVVLKLNLNWCCYEYYYIIKITFFPQDNNCIS